MVSKLDVVATERQRTSAGVRCDPNIVITTTSTVQSHSKMWKIVYILFTFLVLNSHGFTLGPNKISNHAISVHTPMLPKAPIQHVTPLPITQLIPSVTTLFVFGNKKKPVSSPDVSSQYWQGEWVCKDCGYIYNRVSQSLL
jgi:hypothetical protein